jgi:hypothetical protein
LAKSEATSAKRPSSTHWQYVLMSRCTANSSTTRDADSPICALPVHRMVTLPGATIDCYGPHMTARPVADGLFTWPSEAPRLLGTLWTWTTQDFLPKNPPYLGRERAKDFVPFAVGYIEIPGALRVEARLTDVDIADLRIGMEMTVTTVTFAVDDDGTEVVTFAFRPAAPSN